ncbi:MAG: M23 family metallopeptidase [Cytophagales bacterium]|nr:M23 family metallopeptidase [Cytophagales bacterium]
MARIKYYYDTDSCKYERIKISTLDVILNFMGFFFVAMLLAVGIVYITSNYFPSYNEVQLEKENEEFELYYKILNKELQLVNNMLTNLQQRDENVYRTIFEAEPVPLSIRKAGIGGSNRYKDLLEKGIEREDLIVNTFKKIDNLKKQMYIQTKSYDEILELAQDKAKMFASIPAIQPIANKKLKRLASGYGMRIHPIYKVRKMHTGIDFSAPRGTAIYATGDGKVRLIKQSYRGYGKQIEIDHGYGYITKYAHLRSFTVKPGQIVKRGEVIGYVGSTGTSVAPHLHYEVIHKRKKVNPVHYFFNDLTPEEYEEILKLASIENQSLS